MVEFCEIVKTMGKEMWTCKECESKNADTKAVLESIKSIKSELSTIKEGQAEQQAERAEQQAERAQVLEGLKAVEAVAKRMDGLEKTQADQGERILDQEATPKKTHQKN